MVNVVVFVVGYIRSVGGRRSSAAGASRPLALDVDVVGRSPEEACHTVRHGGVDATQVACRKKKIMKEIRGKNKIK